MSAQNKKQGKSSRTQQKGSSGKRAGTTKSSSAKKKIMTSHHQRPSHQRPTLSSGKTRESLKTDTLHSRSSKSAGLRDIRDAEVVHDTSTAAGMLGGELDVGLKGGAGNVGLGPGDELDLSISSDREDALLWGSGGDEVADRVAKQYGSEKSQRAAKKRENGEEDVDEEEEKEPSLLEDFKKNFDIEGRHQGVHPQEDRYEDKINDLGQDVEDSLTAEEKP